MSVADTVRDAGIVGAGGAGFPSHVKFGADKIDTVIANGAECEPLLRCDKAQMMYKADEVLEGLTILGREVGASRLVVALKEHYHDVVDAVRKAAEAYPEVEVFTLENFYPSGDEQVLVYEVTGRVVPEGGIPLAVGCVVNNVVTLSWVARAVHYGEPATSRPITFIGDIKRPRTMVLPVGTTTGEALDLCGGPTVDEVAFIEGGPMMGELHFDPERPLTKKSSGVLVLSREHDLARRKNIASRQEMRLARDVCCSCRFCTDLCPRYLIGHELYPHLVMRAVKHNGFIDLPDDHISNAFLCCMCGVCEIACPLRLSPRRVYIDIRKMLWEAKAKNPHTREPEDARDFRAFRLLPVDRLIGRLGLRAYEHQGWDIDMDVQSVSRVRLPMSQHIGAPSTPMVQVGDAVEIGDVVGEIPEGSLGARVHASIKGVVTRSDAKFVEIERSEA